jgi:hypothetical protein
MLTFACGFLPALGAAMAAISNQGEFRRVARRSKAMSKQLATLLMHIEKLETGIQQPRATGAQQHSRLTGALASEVARLLVNEVLDWRVVFLDRPNTVRHEIC